MPMCPADLDFDVEDTDATLLLDVANSGVARAIKVAYSKKNTFLEVLKEVCHLIGRKVMIPGFFGLNFLIHIFCVPQMSMSEVRTVREF